MRAQLVVDVVAIDPRWDRLRPDGEQNSTNVLATAVWASVFLIVTAASGVCRGVDIDDVLAPACARDFEHPVGAANDPSVFDHSHRRRERAAVAIIEDLEVS
ncbi:hypothetical protein [Halostagnicola sp. A56]|uniref:hypothetical protein n=1 Tax=Halostagnicola sp. A56 TaxID=1495067 RepID=UPI0012E3028C|nr:hypothetical protein [Halostagnicola sp. A56]